MKFDFLESDSIQEIKNCAAQNAVPIVRDEGLEFILNFIEKSGAKRILEIGTGIGYSAIMFAKCAADISVFTIESDAERYEQAQKNIASENLSQRVTCFFGDAMEFDFAEKFDLIFIDGPKAQYIKFFEKFKKNLAHNYSTKKLVKKIRKYIEFLKANEEFETEFFEQGDGISVSVWKN